MSQPIKVENQTGVGMLWFIGWLFTIGFTSKGFLGAICALFVWPYMLGASLI